MSILSKRAVFFIIAALCLVTDGQAHAQRTLPGMRGLELWGGMMDGFLSSDNRNELGCYFGVSRIRNGELER